MLTASDEVDDANGKDAAVILGGASAQLPGSISLDPGQAFNNPIKSPTHSVTATVRDDQGNLVQGADVSFLVVSGPNAGAAGSDLTDSNGQATFGWTSNGAEGTDVVRASFVDDTGQTRSIEATKVWDKTRPTCRGYQRSMTPHRTVVTVQDPLAGIASITASPAVNANMSTDPAAYQGSTSDVTVTLTRQNENQPGRARVAITDRAGNVGYCSGTGYLPV